MATGFAALSPSLCRLRVLAILAFLGIFAMVTPRLPDQHDAVAPVGQRHRRRVYRGGHTGKGVAAHGVAITQPMKVFLDDNRPAPEGWTLVRWPEEVIALLETGAVTELSLDHDLGDDRRTGS